MGRELVDGGDSFVGACVIDVGCEAVDRDNAFAAARVLDVGSEAIDGGNDFAGARILDMGHEAVDRDVGGDHSATAGDNVLAGTATRGIMVTFSETSISSAACSSIPATLALSCKFPGSLTSLT